MRAWLANSEGLPAPELGKFQNFLAIEQKESSAERASKPIPHLSYQRHTEVQVNEHSRAPPRYSLRKEAIDVITYSYPTAQKVDQSKWHDLR